MRALKNGWVFRDRGKRACGEDRRRTLGDVDEHGLERRALELEAAGGHRDPERGDGPAGGVAHRCREAAEIGAKLLAVERDRAGADLGELRAQVSGEVIVAGVKTRRPRPM